MFICKWGRENSWCSLRCVCFAVSWLCLHTDTAPLLLLPPWDLQGVEAPIFGTKTYILCQNENNKPTKESPAPSAKTFPLGLALSLPKIQHKLGESKSKRYAPHSPKKNTDTNTGAATLWPALRPLQVLGIVSLLFITLKSDFFFFKLQWMSTQDLFSFIFSGDQKVTDYSLSARGEYIS